MTAVAINRTQFQKPPLQPVVRTPSAFESERARLTSILARRDATVAVRVSNEIARMPGYFGRFLPTERRILRIIVGDLNKIGRSF